MTSPQCRTQANTLLDLAAAGAPVHPHRVAIALVVTGDKRKRRCNGPRIGWADDEKSILRTYYPSEGTAVSKRLPGRTPGACQNMAGAMSIKRNFEAAEAERLAIIELNEALIDPPIEHRRLAVGQWTFDHVELPPSSVFHLGAHA